MKDKDHIGVLKAFVGWTRPLFYKFFFTIFKKHRRKDVLIRQLLPGEQLSYRNTFEKIDQALDLILEFDPRRYRRICRDVKNIWVFETPPGIGQWCTEMQMCILDRDYTCSINTSPAQIASLIVNLAIHARLYRQNIKYTQPDRNRIHQLCFKSQISFARRLPNEEALIREAEAYLQLPENFWSDAEGRERNLDEFAKLGEKSLLARLLYRPFKRLAQKLNASDNKRSE